MLLLLLLLLLPLREARRRSRESPDPRHAAAPEAVPHGRRLLLELSSSGIRSVRAELIRVGRGLSGIHLYDAAAVGGTRRSRSRRGRRGDYPPVEPVIQHGQRREDAGLEPREKDNGRARAGLGEAVVCMSVLKGARFYFRERSLGRPRPRTKRKTKGAKTTAPASHPICDARDASSENTAAATVHHPASAADADPSSQSPARTPEHRASESANDAKIDAAETV